MTGVVVAECSCPRWAITNQAKHDEWHALVREQVGHIPEDPPLTIHVLRAVRGFGEAFDVFDHKIQDKLTRTGKHTSKAAKMRAREP